MDVCKCGARTVSYMVKAGKKIKCTGCGREDTDERYKINLPLDKL